MSNTNAFTRPKTLFSVWRKQFSQQPLCSRGNQGPCLSNTDPVHTNLVTRDLIFEDQLFEMCDECLETMYL